MLFYDMDDAVLESPEAKKDESGQEQNAESKSKEVPENGTEGVKKTTEEPKTGETSEEGGEETEEIEKLTKDYTANFQTRAALVKSAENLKIALNEEVDFDKMTLDQVKEWYNEKRPELGKKGFRGNREQVKQYNQAAKEDDKLARIEAKLDKLDPESQKQTKTEPEEVKPPQRPKFDWKKYNALIIDDPDQAAEMMEQYDQAQQEYMDKRIEYEGHQVGKAIKPMAERDAARLKREQDERDVEEWGEAFKTVGALIADEYSEEEIKELKAILGDIIGEDRPYYEALAKTDGKERAILKLFTDAQKERELRALKAERAATKNGETQDQINAAKGAARNSQTNGGVTKKQAGPISEAEAKERSLAAVRGPSNKYEIFD